MNSKNLLRNLGLFASLLAITGSATAPAFAQDKMDDDHAMMKMMQSRSKALKQADATVTKEKQKAMKAGKYNCCLKHPCDFCALKMGACPCGKMATMDKPVCNECKGGWAAGDGAISGKTADDIKTMPRMEMKMDGKKMGKAGASRSNPIEVWHCPMTGEAIADRKGAGTPALVGSYRIHFCCAGCDAKFAKLTATQKKAKAAASAKLDKSA